MSLYNVNLYADGQFVNGRDCRGSCTGVFQANGYGYFANPERNFDTVTVEFMLYSGLSAAFFEGMCKTPLMQALVPGLEYVEATTTPNNNKAVVVRFPNVDTLPSDQVISAMRIINSWGNGEYGVSMKLLREYELTVNEKMIIGMFGHRHPNYSDSKPSLWYLSKEDSRKAVEGKPSYNHVNWQIDAKKEPKASMLLPLLRGEINPGWQPPLTKGYLKEGALVGFFSNDPYRAREWMEACGDDQFITINHPLIHPSNEGPPLNVHTDLTRVTDWVLQQIGK